MGVWRYKGQEKRSHPIPRRREEDGEEEKDAETVAFILVPRSPGGTGSMLWMSGMRQHPVHVLGPVPLSYSQEAQEAQVRPRDKPSLPSWTRLCFRGSWGRLWGPSRSAIYRRRKAPCVQPPSTYTDIIRDQKYNKYRDVE